LPRVTSRENLEKGLASGKDLPQGFGWV
jgi:hypothetical protein